MLCGSEVPLKKKCEVDQFTKIDRYLLNSSSTDDLYIIEATFPNTWHLFQVQVQILSLEANGVHIKLWLTISFHYLLSSVTPTAPITVVSPHAAYLWSPCFQALK